MELKDLKVYELAKMVRNDWKKVYFGAVPYLDAMDCLCSVNDKFYEDDGKSIVIYFLANAGSWRGEVAKAVKAELNRRIK